MKAHALDLDPLPCGGSALPLGRHRERGRPDLLGKRRRRQHLPRQRRRGGWRRHPDHRGQRQQPGTGSRSTPPRGRSTGSTGTEPTYSIRFANLDGSGGGILNTTGAPVVRPARPRDRSRRRAGSTGSTSPTTSSTSRTSTAQGGGELDTTGAVVETPVGLAVYPAQNRIYWANFEDGTDDRLRQPRRNRRRRDPRPHRAPQVDMPTAIAIDALTNRVYWANGSSIGFASANGGNGGEVDTHESRPTILPEGIAIDPFAKHDLLGGRASRRHRLHRASTRRRRVRHCSTRPARPSTVRHTRSCSRPPQHRRADRHGIQELDPADPEETEARPAAGAAGREPHGDAQLLAGLLGRRPARVVPLSGAAEDLLLSGCETSGRSPGRPTSSLVATEVGDYTCRDTASNAAGSTPEDSASVNISASLKLGKAVLNAEKGIAKIPVATSGTGVVALSGKGVKPQEAEDEAWRHRVAAGDTRPQAAGQGRREARIRRRSEGEGEDLLHAHQRVAADEDEVVQPAAGGGLTRNRAWST